MQQDQKRLLTKVSTLAAALAMAGAAWAATPAPEAAPSGTTAVEAPAQAKADKPGHHHRKTHRHHREIGLLVPGYGPVSAEVLKSLALNDKQAKLVEEAKTFQKDRRSANREAMKDVRQDRAEQLKAGKLDPRAALKDSEAMHEKAAQQHKESNEKWLAVWDALDDTQKQTLAKYFSDRLEKREKYGERAWHGAKHRQYHDGLSEGGGKAAPDSAPATADKSAS